MGFFDWFGGRSGSLPQKGPRPAATPDDPRPQEQPYRPMATGFLGWLRASLFGWPGKDAASSTRVEGEVLSEKVRGGPQNIVRPWFLPYPDDQTGETQQMRLAYRAMWRDANVKAALLTKIFAVGALDLDILPADAKSKKARKNRDKRYEKHAEFARWTLNERIQGGLPGIAWAILSGGTMDGYSVSEKVWQCQDSGQYSGNYVLESLKPKDTGRDVVLETDQFLNVVGVRTLRYNAGEIYHPSNFVLFSHLPFFGRPTGMSDLRAAYRPYWLLDTVHKLRAMGLEKRALPVVYGAYQTSSQRPTLEAALAQIRSQSWFSIPEGVRVDVLNIAGASDGMFAQAITDLREELFIAISHATLQSLTGQQGAQRGSSKVHQATSDLPKWYLKACLETLLNDHDSGLIRDLIDLNHVTDQYPRATLGAIDPEDMLQEAQLDGLLLGMGLKLSKADLYEKYGRTPPDDDDPDDVLESPGGGPGGGGGGSDAQFRLLDQNKDGHLGKREYTGQARKPTSVTSGFVGQAHAEWDESQHKRDAGGQFTAGTDNHYAHERGKIEAGHEAGKQAVRQEYDAGKEAIRKEYQAGREELQASLRGKVEAAKEAGRKKLGRLAKQQKALEEKHATATELLADSQAATGEAHKAVQTAHAGGGYLADVLDSEFSLSRLDSYSAADVLTNLREALKNTAWDPAQDEDWSQTEYDDATDSDAPIHTPEETAIEKTRRGEARKKLQELISDATVHGMMESRTEAREKQVDAFDDEIGQVEEKRQAVVEETNEKIQGHREVHEEKHDRLKEKIHDRHQENFDRAADAHHSNHTRHQGDLDALRARHVAARQELRQQGRLAGDGTAGEEKATLHYEAFADRFRLDEPATPLSVFDEPNWDESKHPRGEGGRFGHGSGGGKDKPAKQDRKAKEKERRAKVRSMPEGEQEWGAAWDDFAGATPVAEHLVRSEKARQEAWSSLLGRASKFVGGLRDGLARMGTAAYNAMPPGIQHALAIAGNVGGALGMGLGKLLSGLGAVWGYVEHTLLNPIKQGVQALAKEAARERGLPEDEVQKLGSVLAITDNVFAWTTNIPLAHEILHHTVHIEGWTGFAVAKLAFFLPLGSLAYLAYSAVRNPAAMVRAAANVLERAVTGIPGPDSHKSHAEETPLMGKELADALAQRFADAADGDWYHALFCAAFDRTHDARQSLKLADAALTGTPSGHHEANQVTPQEMLAHFEGYAPPQAAQAHSGGGEVDIFTRRARRELMAERRSDGQLNGWDTEAFLLGVWVDCDSSNVRQARYVEEEQRLDIGYGKPGGPITLYGYPGISVAEAREFAASASKGGHASDYLKGRDFVKL